MELHSWLRLGLGVGAAIAVAYLCTPLAIRAARRFAFYDLPAGYKGHGSPTPYLGGTAVMAAFALALLAGAGDPRHTLPLIGGVAVLGVVGTIDDRRTVSPRLRVAIELALGVLLSLAGLGWRIGPPVLDAAITAIWLVGVVNAFNLFDNMDGAASTMAAVVAAGACGLAVVTGSVWVAAGSAALCGACLGFLPHNLSSPAKIFLGDGGSMPLGLSIAILVAAAAQHAESSSLALLVGFLLVGIPVLDTTLVIVSRRRRGVSVLTGGRDHLTHRTRQRMGTPKRVALVLGAAQALVSGVVILASRDSPSMLVYIVLAFVILCAVAIVALEDAISNAPTAVHQLAVNQPQRREPGSWPSRFPDLCLAILGLGAGLSPFFSAYYNLGVWTWLGLGLVLVAAMATIARPVSFNLALGLVVAGLAGLGLWSLISTSWANGIEAAVQDGNLWLSYAAFLLLACALIRRPGQRFILLGAAGAGIVIVGLSVLVRMLGSNPGDLFLAGRLNSPLGYINGEGCVFAMGAWFGLALAERRNPLMAGVGMAITVMMAGLALLSQSRGAAIASLAAVLVVLIAVPGFRRRVLALAAAAASLVLAYHTILLIYRTGQVTLTPVVAHHAALYILLGAGAAGGGWGALAALAGSVERRGGGFANLFRRAINGLVVVLIAAPIVVAAVRASSIAHAVRVQWHAFTHLTATRGGGSGGAQDRLLSGGGNRYDYWRVAWHVFLHHPLAGVGAGNFPEYYFLQRRTVEAIQNPHSIELQMLSELGIVGGLLLLIFLAGVILGGARLRALAAGSRDARTVLVAAAGMFVVWLVDSSGDWMVLLPGVSAIALCAVAVLCRGHEPAERATSRPRQMLVAAGLAAFVLAVAGASLLRTGLAERYLDEAKVAVASQPAVAIGDAQRALNLDSANLDAYYIKAAGQARFDNPVAARRTLLQAVGQDPSSFVTYTLLGDLEVRAGHLRAAHGYYAQALRLDPREPTLVRLVTDTRQRKT